MPDDYTTVGHGPLDDFVPKDVVMTEDEKKLYIDAIDEVTKQHEGLAVIGEAVAKLVNTLLDKIPLPT